MMHRRPNSKSLETVTAADGDAVSLADLKAYLVIESTSDDDMLTRFIAQAQQAVQDYIHRAIQPQTLRLWMDAFPGDNDDALVALGSGIHDISRRALLGDGDMIDLPMPPLVSVSSVKTYDTLNTESTFDSAAYMLDGSRGRLVLNSGYSWPTGLRAYRGVAIEYVAGYATIPGPIVAGITAYAAHLYECRGVCTMPDTCKAMIEPYRIVDRLAW